jgi:hypothetical protein
MTAEERRFILWGFKEGWSAARIGRELGVNEATVRRFRAALKKKPETLLELGLHDKAGDGHRCLVCGEVSETRPAVDRHVLLHYVDEEAADRLVPAPVTGSGPAPAPASGDEPPSAPPVIEIPPISAEPSTPEEPDTSVIEVPSVPVSSPPAAPPPTGSPLDPIVVERPPVEVPGEPEPAPMPGFPASGSPASEVIEIPPVSEPAPAIQPSPESPPKPADDPNKADKSEGADRRAEFERLVADRIAMQDAISRESDSSPESSPESLSQAEKTVHSVPESVTGHIDTGTLDFGLRPGDEGPGPVSPEDEIPGEESPEDESGEDFGFRAAFQQLAAERGQPEPGPEPAPAAEPASPEDSGPNDPDPNDAGMDAAMGLLMEQQEAIQQAAAGNAAPSAPQQQGESVDADEFRQAFEQLAATRENEPPGQPSGDRSDTGAVDRSADVPEAPAPEPDMPAEDFFKAAMGDLADMQSTPLTPSVPATPEPTPQAAPTPGTGPGVGEPKESDSFGMREPAEPEKPAVWPPPVAPPAGIGDVEKEIAALGLQDEYQSLMETVDAEKAEAEPELPSFDSDLDPERGPGAKFEELLERYAPSVARIALPLVAKARDLAADAGLVGAPEVASLTFEHGYIKILVSKGLKVLDMKIVETNPRIFREGMVSDPRRASMELAKAISELKIKPKRFIGAAPGYQTNAQDIEMPLRGQIDPKLVLPREARKVMGVSADTSYLAWHRLPDDIDNAHWLIISATKRSVASLTTTAQAAGVKIRDIELRAFALARAINLPDVVIAWSAIDGCDAVIVRDWEPMVVQSAYWGAEPRAEGDVLINRISEVAERATMTHAQQNPETPLSDDTPVVVTGTPIASEPDVASRVAGILRRPLERIEPAMHLPEGFPIDDMVVNVGLALWSA